MSVLGTLSSPTKEDGGKSPLTHTHTHTAKVPAAAPRPREEVKTERPGRSAVHGGRPRGARTGPPGQHLLLTTVEAPRAQGDSAAWTPAGSRPLEPEQLPAVALREPKSQLSDHQPEAAPQMDGFVFFNKHLNHAKCLKLEYFP